MSEAAKAMARLFDPPSEPEAPPPPEGQLTEVMQLPESAGRGFSESELVTLRTIFKATVDEGHALHRCDFSEQAQRWSVFLNQHLPHDRECFVIRKQEVNAYTIGNPMLEPYNPEPPEAA